MSNRGIVVKKGEVMSEPTRAVPTGSVREMADALARCQEARANADRELRELREALAVAIDDWEGLYATSEMREAVKRVWLRASERKS